VVAPQEAEYAKHVYHVYAVRVPRRDEVLSILADDGIGCGIHYPVPVHLQTAYAELGLPPGSFPVSEACAREFLSLPMFPEMTDEQIVYVAERLREAVAG
jgi:dTDP-4-amino-4,6-dideoxygalactose transaminase